jgi:serine/threonine-protein kinase HipA
MAECEVEVIVQIAGENVPAGRLWSHRRRGRESATFEYLPDYLARPDGYALEPSLPLLAGQQQTATGQAMFAAFSDCAPDRWGRRLIERRERHRARHARSTERSFGEIDYLLGVRDDLRQGAVRFRDPDAGTYLADEAEGVPHLIDLPHLLHAAEHLERDEASEKELQALLRGGSSLGGARPKAHVLDGEGRIGIAKFPSPGQDKWEVTRWEAVALSLAQHAGIDVPRHRLETIDGRGVLIVRRFDRSGSQRIAYVSAMTMVELIDRETGSYLDMVSVIEEQSPDATRDLHELWRRIAFTVLISNTDDHLRNHGFLRSTTAGWSLSPAFDLNPDPRPGPRHLATAIDYGQTEASLQTLLGVAEHFRMTTDEAHRVLAPVLNSVSGWRRAAAGAGLDVEAIAQMEPAFEHEQAALARELLASKSVVSSESG